MFAEHHLNRLQNLNVENKKTKREKTMNKIAAIRGTRKVISDTISLMFRRQ